MSLSDLLRDMRTELRTELDFSLLANRILSSREPATFDSLDPVATPETSPTLEDPVRHMDVLLLQVEACRDPTIQALGTWLRALQTRDPGETRAAILLGWLLLQRTTDKSANQRIPTALADLRIRGHDLDPNNLEESFRRSAETLRRR